MGPLEWALNTPSHHRVHHARNRYAIDKNYGGLLIVWDRLFGTFAAEREWYSRNMGGFVSFDRDGAEDGGNRREIEARQGVQNGHEKFEQNSGEDLHYGLVHSITTFDMWDVQVIYK